MQVWLKQVRYLAAVCLVASFWMWQTARVSAWQYWCYEEMCLAVYTGEEVECSGSYPQGACEAFCELCFGAACGEVQHCEEGTGIGFYCDCVLE